MDYEVTAEVGAPAEKVWAVLADLEGWPGWTASMRQVQPLDDGPVRVGTRVRVRQPSLPTVVWTVTEWTPGTGFTWESTNPGVTTAGDHELTEDAGRTTVTLRIRQEGFLAPLVHLLIGRRTRRYMQLEADGLATRVQSG
jgi:uncharacterized membrane protein